MFYLASLSDIVMIVLFLWKPIVCCLWNRHWSFWAKIWRMEEIINEIMFSLVTFSKISWKIPPLPNYVGLQVSKRVPVEKWIKTTIFSATRWHLNMDFQPFSRVSFFFFENTQHKMLIFCISLLHEVVV